MYQFVLLSESYMIDFGQMVPQLVFHMIMVLVLFFVLGKLLFKPVQKILEKRKETVEGQIEGAKKDQETAKALREEYEAKLQNANEERERILAEAYKTAKKREEVILEEAQQEAALIKERTRKDLEREQAKARDELRKETVQMAVMLAQRFVSASIRPQDQNALIEEALAGVEDAEWKV